METSPLTSVGFGSGSRMAPIQPEQKQEKTGGREGTQNF